MENTIRGWEKVYLGNLMEEGDESALNFLKNKKNWSDFNFKKVTENSQKFNLEACAIVCYCRLVLNKKPNLRKIAKCVDIINISLSIIDSSGLKATDYLVNLVLNVKENSVDTLIRTYNLIKQILPFASEKRKDIEGRLEMKLRKGLKKLICNIKSKTLIKYLSLGFSLLRNSVLKAPDSKILMVLAYQFLEFTFKLHDCNKNIENFLDPGYCIEQGIVICKLIDMMENGIDTYGYLSKFIRKIWDYRSVELDISRYPYKLMDDYCSKQLNLDQMIEEINIFESKSMCLSLNKYVLKLDSQKNLVKKIYFISDNIKYEHLKNEFNYHSYLDKLNFSNNYSLERLLGHNFACSDRIIYYFDCYEEPLIYLFTKYVENHTYFEEHYLTYLSKSLIKTCSLLESKRIHHGNLKPHHLYLNKDRKVVISDFPFLGMINFDLHYTNHTSLIQGVNGYSAPEAPEGYNYNFNYRKHKSDVFSVGLILLQAYYLGPVNKISTDQNLMLDHLNRIQYPWLKLLLQQMLDFNFKSRACFSELYSQIKLYKFPSYP